MTTATRKPAQPATGTVQWINRLTLPVGFGRFSITVQTSKGEVTSEYDIQPALDRDNTVLGFGLAKDDDTVYHLGVGQWGWTCDCPNSEFKRPGECKHVRAVKAALKAIGLEVAPPKPQPAPTVCEFDAP